jgi:hypothetical protein
MMKSAIKYTRRIGLRHHGIRQLWGFRNWLGQVEACACCVMYVCMHVHYNLFWYIWACMKKGKYFFWVEFPLWVKSIHIMRERNNKCSVAHLHHLLLLNMHAHTHTHKNDPTLLHTHTHTHKHTHTNDPSLSCMKQVAGGMWLRANASECWST